MPCKIPSFRTISRSDFPLLLLILMYPQIALTPSIRSGSLEFSPLRTLATYRNFIQGGDDGQ